jgi:16S rRNA G966 N2-methylase RsmD
MCGFEHKTSVIKTDLGTDTDLGKYTGTPEGFDAVFMDPPYQSGLIPHVSRLLTTGGMLRPDAYVIAETAKDEPLPGPIEGLIPVRAKTYGDTRISVFFCEDE